MNGALKALSGAAIAFGAAACPPHPVVPKGPPPEYEEPEAPPETAPAESGVVPMEAGS